MPLLSLAGLWVFATTLTLGDGLRLLHVETLQDHLGYPAGALGSALQEERRSTLVYLGGHGPDARASMESQRIRTDRQADLFRRLANDPDTQSVASARTRSRTSEALTKLRSLHDARTAIDSGAVSRTQAFSTYSDIIADINRLDASLSTLSDPSVAKEYQSLVTMTRAREALSQEDALFAGALAAGHLTPKEHAKFVKLVGVQRYLYSQATSDLPETNRAYYRNITATSQFARLRKLEDRVIGSAHAPITATRWKATADSVLTKLRGLELAATSNAAQRTRPVATGIILRIGLAGVLGLLALVASILISARIARSVLGDLTGLRNAAQELADRRLPGVVRRLRRGEDVDAAAEAPSLAFRTSEIDQVGQAFNAARRTAIQGAVEEASLRRSVNVIFTNLARRSQALLHRQLSLLDTMERRKAEPEELGDLFRLDHLATRMRRHAEGLLILSGSAPGRGWRRSVPLIDVARAAASEVEDYHRVTVRPMPGMELVGQAVADLVHMLAELIENATLFSPPHTPVQVTGQMVGNGFVMEIEDRGLSMSQDDMSSANDRLANPPEFDLSDSARLGLFVVGRLAERHGIKITLRPSAYGGTTAVVLMPPEIIVSDKAVEPPLHTEGNVVDQGRTNGWRPAISGGNGSAPRRDAEPRAGQQLAQAEGEPADHQGPERQPPARRPRPEPDHEHSRRSSSPPTVTGGAARLVDGRPALPRRVRQASLAPQLKDDPALSEEPPGEDEDERSPEELRMMLSSIQRGWLRGRSDAGETTGEDQTGSIEAASRSTDEDER
ncbi:MAG: sensor histidine kinase [Streptosporangiaceae bacterium]